mgnify:FL=1
MNKFYGIVGYAETVETDSPGVWVEKITERNYYGDVLRNTRRWETASGQVNDNLNVNNSISIVADGYAYDHFSEIRYVQWRGRKWQVTNVEDKTPRLILTIGGVYNGPES